MGQTRAEAKEALLKKLRKMMIKLAEAERKKRAGDWEGVKKALDIVEKQKKKMGKNLNVLLHPDYELWRDGHDQICWDILFGTSALVPFPPSKEQLRRACQDINDARRKKAILEKKLAGYNPETQAGQRAKRALSRSVQRVNDLLDSAERKKRNRDYDGAYKDLRAAYKEKSKWLDQLNILIHSDFKFWRQNIARMCDLIISSRGGCLDIQTGSFFFDTRASVIRRICRFIQEMRRKIREMARKVNSYPV